MYTIQHKVKKQQKINRPAAFRALLNRLLHEKDINPIYLQQSVMKFTHISPFPNEEPFGFEDFEMKTEQFNKDVIESGVQGYHIFTLQLCLFTPPDSE